MANPISHRGIRKEPLQLNKSQRRRTQRKASSAYKYHNLIQFKPSPSFSHQHFTGGGCVVA
ncbi:hypothetical protein Hdeb2414_s0232g00842161 [Helianthus debilis subsp. tardiflorus]